jgi:hypothetical protein
MNQHTTSANAQTTNAQAGWPIDSYSGEVKPHDRAMKQEHFEQVIEAILSGKYSWACVLILKFAGYNPLHYIPYRTYNRIMKDNVQRKSKHHDRETQSVGGISQSTTLSFPDLNYTKPAHAAKQVQGGSSRQYSSRQYSSRQYSRWYWW